jgi:L-malate glycosyltransferase
MGNGLLGMRPKILILPSWYPSETSRLSGVFIEDQALVLSRIYDVAVLFPRLVGYRELIEWKIGPRVCRETRNGVEVNSERVLAPFPRKSRLAHCGYYRKARQLFGSMLRAWGRPDVIHAHVVLPAGWTATRLGQEFSIPVVLTEHSGPFSMHLRTDCSRRLVRETLRKTDRRIVVSPWLGDQVREFEKNTSTDVIGNVVRTDFFKPGETKEEGDSRVRFLSVGSLMKNKGFFYLVEAARILKQRGLLSFQMNIGGDGPERASLRRHIEVSGLSDCCFLLGAMTREGVRDEMQRSDAFVLPSLQETFGVVLLEAMACGKPVISTRCGGPDSVVTDETGCLVSTEDPVGLANIMEAFIAGRIRFDSNRVRETVRERFGEDAFLGKISRLYSEVGVTRV